MALSEVDKKRLSKEDQDRILAYTEAWEKANAAGDEAGKKAANEGANAIRENAGYYGDDWGRYNGEKVQKKTNNSYNFNSNIYSKYDEALAQQKKALKEAEERAAEAQRLAVANGVNTLNLQKLGINQKFDEAQKQAYINNQLGTQNIEQLLKGMGYTGGLAESNALDKRAAYENILNSNKIANNNAINAIDTDISNLKNTGDLNIANNASDYQKMLVDILGENLYNQVAQMNADRNFNYGVYRDSISDDRYNNEWNYNVSRDNLADERYNNEWNYNVGRDNLEDQRYIDEWNYKKQQDAIANNLAQNKSNNSSTSKPSKTQYDIAIKLAESGQITDDVKSIIESYTGFDFDTVSKMLNLPEIPTDVSTDNQEINKDYVNQLLNQENRKDRLALDTIVLPYPDPDKIEQVMKNAWYMKNKGYDFDLIKKYAKRYGYDIEE